MKVFLRNLIGHNIFYALFLPVFILANLFGWNEIIEPFIWPLMTVCIYLAILFNIYLERRSGELASKNEIRNSTYIFITVFCGTMMISYLLQTTKETPVANPNFLDKLSGEERRDVEKGANVVNELMRQRSLNKETEN
ncbi:MAG: hypothetical protein COA78_03755 [Blastopirellula sp.]|nr:MAG: hypothetical protein COA78_03755 [Blastopirellula sp.]